MGQHDGFEVRDQRGQGWHWMANEVYDHYAARVKVHAFAVYVALTRYADGAMQCYPSLTTLCDKLDLSRPTVVKAIKKLEREGLIKIDRRTGFKDSNVYTLLSVPKQVVNPANQVGVVNPANQLAPFTGVVNPANHGQSTALTGVVNAVDSNNTHRTRPTGTRPSNNPPPPAAEVSLAENDPRFAVLKQTKLPDGISLAHIATAHAGRLSTWRCGRIRFLLPLAGDQTLYAPVTEDFIRELGELNPGLDVENNLKQIRVAMRDDQSKRRPPEKLAAFIRSWCKKETADAQSRGGPSARPRPKAPPSVDRLRIVNV